MHPTQEAYVNGTRFGRANADRYGIPATLDMVLSLETSLVRARKPVECRRFLAGALDALLTVAQVSA